MCRWKESAAKLLPSTDTSDVQITDRLTNYNDAELNQLNKETVMKTNFLRIVPLALLSIVFTLNTAAFAQYTETWNVGVPGLYTDSPPVTDATGNFYGATGGGIGNCYPYGCGQIFQIPPGAQNGNIIYQFTGTTDGSGPHGRLTVDTNGNLYGVTSSGGNMSGCGGSGCGVVYKLSPNSSGTWTETVLYVFAGGADGSSPYGGVRFDSQTNLYGRATAGGNANCYGSQDCGLVFELSPNASGGWTKTTPHTFTGGHDGGGPSGLLTLDKHDNVYGTALVGGNLTACRYGCGTVFRLTRVSNSTWSFNRPYAFNATRGRTPTEALLFTKAANLYGTTQVGGKLVNNSSYCPFATCGPSYDLIHNG